MGPETTASRLRRAALVSAAIDEIAAAGSLDVTVGQIARRAGISSALAHHYFGTKEAIFLSAMRHILWTYGTEVRAGLSRAADPAGRLDAILQASFAPSNYRPETVSAWLSFYVAAPGSARAARLLGIYRARLRSNLLHALRPLAGPAAEPAADGLGALIDGLYLRQATPRATLAPEAALAIARDFAARVTGGPGSGAGSA